MTSFSIRNWFWFVGGDQTKVFSSAAAAFVPSSDPSYAAFVAAGGQAQIINSLSELKDVFAVQYPAGMLATYAAAKRYAKETGGTTINGVPYPTDRETQSKMAAAVLLSQINTAVSFQWKLADGTFATLNAANVLAVASAVGAFVQSCFAQEANAVAAITAGTITTLAQVDAAFV